MNIPPIILVVLILPILAIILLLRWKLSSKKVPTMTTNDIGNGTSIEMVMLIPKDIPIQTSCVLTELNPILSPFYSAN